MRVPPWRGAQPPGDGKWLPPGDALRSLALQTWVAPVDSFPPRHHLLAMRQAPTLMATNGLLMGADDSDGQTCAARWRHRPGWFDNNSTDSAAHAWTSP
jgi:hypothetical protein